MKYLKKIIKMNSINKIVLVNLVNQPISKRTG